jgi:hypothetical protein
MQTAAELAVLPSSSREGCHGRQSCNSGVQLNDEGNERSAMIDEQFDTARLL